MTISELCTWKTDRIIFMDDGYIVEEEKPESPEKPKETEIAKTVATGDGSYVKILVFLIGVILTGALLLCFLLSRMWGRMWKRR